MICYSCQSLYHEGESCSSYLKRTLIDWKAQAGARFCPKCNTIIEKNGGCSHMKCGKCSYDFCYSCGLSQNTIFHSGINPAKVFMNCASIQERTTCYWIGNTIFLILSLFVVPICLFFGPILAGIFAMGHFFCKGLC